MSIEDPLAAHYTHGQLEQAIRSALVAEGRDLERLAHEDLAAVDEFHIGGRQATADLAEQLELRRGMHLLDIGSGLGGAGRYLAAVHGCRVTGVDVTPEYVDVANSLARWTGLDHLVGYRQGSALDLPFEPGAFDGAYMLHVGMNVADKQALFAQVRRVLRPGAPFAVYDVMRTGEGDLGFPVPWAEGPEASFEAEAATYRELLERAGFTVEKERDRRDFAIEFFARMSARMAEGGPPPLGLHIVMGDSSALKRENMVSNLERGLIAPTEMICRAV